jgi:hypothetical protein
MIAGVLALWMLSSRPHGNNSSKSVVAASFGGPVAAAVDAPSSSDTREPEYANYKVSLPESIQQRLAMGALLKAAARRTETSERAAPPVETGTLAISSPITTYIYISGELVGSTPATLELPAGLHKVEYRRGNLRTAVTVAYLIRRGETTRAKVPFEIPNSQ